MSKWYWKCQSDTESSSYFSLSYIFVFTKTKMFSQKLSQNQSTLFTLCPQRVPHSKNSNFSDKQMKHNSFGHREHTKSKWLKDALGELVIVILVIQFNWRWKAVLVQNFIVSTAEKRQKGMLSGDGFVCTKDSYTV